MFKAPTESGLRGDYSRMDCQYVVPQDWDAYPAADHDRWRRLYRRQSRVVRAHASPAFLQALDGTDCGAEIPHLDRVSARLQKTSGWSLVAVPGLIPNDVFFGHLAARRFPVTSWIRDEHELDYLVEPDIFHDFYGHVPMLFQPRFAEAMQAYGARGLEAGPSGHGRLARLYWYLVEFGLELRPEGLKAFGAGILSSAAETVFSVSDPSPNRVMFDLRRVLRTRYRIDDFQETYFVLEGFDDLLRAIDQPMEAVLQGLTDDQDLEPFALAPDDRVVTPGQGPRQRRGYRA